MPAVACQRGSFADLDAPDGAELPVCPRVARRGRGAVAVRRVTMRLRGARNPAGRSKLLFAYRPLRSWRETTLRLIHEFLERYFARIGGFRVARDSTVRVWHEALASDLYTAEELRWAIDAKAASLAGDTPAETRAKRKFVCGPGRFLAFAGYWLERSPGYQARVERDRAIERDGSAARLVEARDAAARRELDDIKARVEGRSALREEQRARVAARRAAVWGSLSPARQAVALQATERAFRERCEQWGMAPDSPELAQLRVDFGRNWAAVKWPPDANVTGDSRADRTCLKCD